MTEEPTNIEEPTIEDEPTIAEEPADTEEQEPEESENIEEPAIEEEPVIAEEPISTEEQEIEEFSNMEESSTEELELTTESVTEAVLFASDEPLSANRLADIVGITVKQIREHVKDLNDKYQTNANAFRIEQIAGGYQMMTLGPFNHWLKKLLRARSDSKLSPAALETLAIIAYKQPVIRADIEAIRGVAAGEMIRNLMYKGLVKIVGRAEVLGRPMLYGTTKKFLEVFGLNTLKDLPKIEELKKPPA